MKRANRSRYAQPIAVFGPVRKQGFRPRAGPLLGPTAAATQAPTCQQPQTQERPPPVVATRNATAAALGDVIATAQQIATWRRVTATVRRKNAALAGVG